MLTIGSIVAAHGLHGDVRVQPLTDCPTRFDDLDEVWLATPQRGRKRYEIKRAHAHGTRALIVLKLEGVNARPAALELVGATLEIDDEQAVELPEGTYFEHDIIGLSVVTTEGRALGEITEILHTGANDVYVTPECLIPAIPDVVSHIDIEGGTVTIVAVPGLLDD